MKPIKLSNDTIFAGCWHLDHQKDFIWKTRGFTSPETHADRICADIAGYYRDHPTAKLVYLGDGFLNSTPERVTAYFARMGIPIFYIWGNHEGPTTQLYNVELARIGFKTGAVYPLEYYNVTFLGEQAAFSIDGQHVIAHHFPLAVWDKSHHGTWCVHSHNHGSFKESLPDYLALKRLDCGVDVCLKAVGKTYMTFDEVRRIMDRKSVHKVDHHGPETT